MNYLGLIEFHTIGTQGKKRYSEAGSASWNILIRQVTSLSFEAKGISVWNLRVSHGISPGGRSLSVLITMHTLMWC